MYHVVNAIHYSSFYLLIIILSENIYLVVTAVRVVGVKWSRRLTNEPVVSDSAQDPTAHCTCLLTQWLQLCRGEVEGDDGSRRCLATVWHRSQLHHGE